LYQRSEPGFGQGGGAATLALSDAIVRPRIDRASAATRFGGRFADIDFVPDLGARIGSRDWWRGLATLTALCATAVALGPRTDQRLPGAVPAPLADADWQAARAQAIAPLAWGADSGRRMAATDLVRPLAETPERPVVELTATLGAGDGFARVLERAGVAPAEAGQIASAVAAATPLDGIKPGTRLDIRLGRRPNKRVPRPLEALAFRARFDLRIEANRAGSGLVVNPIPIAVDDTPLRVQGRVGDSLYRAARAAGAPPKAVEAYLRAVATKMSVGGIGADARFDLIVAQRRAETGEVEIGELLFAGLEQGKRRLRLLKWTVNGRSEWFDAAGVGERTGGMVRPVTGRQTSGFGMRLHPLLGYNRLHRGVDYRAPHGAPVYAVTDGTVRFAGRNGGHGNHVRLDHAGKLGSGYSHLSRIAVRAGQKVRRGQVIGYVGSTGLSTGPHLHFEVYRNGAAINPRQVSFTTVAQLSGSELRAFRSRLAGLMAVRSVAAPAATPAAASATRIAE
jgi:murein DD-endopeptidase MepM/ murein hydrolase activator NlpD